MRDAARSESLRALVKDEIREILRAANPPSSTAYARTSCMIVGVNGTGKTTTVGKLARLIKESGKIAAHLRRRYVPRRRRRAARDLGDARRRRHHPRADGRRSGGGGVRRDCRRQGARPRRAARRHRRAGCTPA